MTNPQGTLWETEIVTAAKNRDHTADRYPKRGQKGEPDLYIGDELLSRVGALFWKRLVGKKSAGRRKPDGVRAVVVLDYEDFMEMLPYLPYRFEVQAKWTSALNVTRTLGDLLRWMKEHLK